MVKPDIGDQCEPPWVKHSGWPFVEESWTLEADVRRGLRIDVNEALDTDQALDVMMPPSLPPLHRLEVLGDVFLDLLSNLPDGIVTVELWRNIESKSFPGPKTKPKSAPSDLKAEVLELMSTSQAHSISFILLTSMLTRISQEIASSFGSPAIKSSISSLTKDALPNSPKVKVRRKTLDQDPIIARRQLMDRNFAAIFGDVLVRIPDSETAVATEAHRRELIEMFIASNG